MLSILLATAALFHTSTATMSAASVTAASATTISTFATPHNPDNVHLVRAREALDAGNFDLARREYVMAAALEREAGRLPFDATVGLAHVLYSQSYTREAAIVLDQLARDAATVGDVDAEARALADAIWLNNETKQYAQARTDAARLRVLMKSGKLSAETRRHIEDRTS